VGLPEGSTKRTTRNGQRTADAQKPAHYPPPPRAQLQARDGPKRSPGAVTSSTGAKKQSSKSSPRKQEPERRSLAIYCGREALGTIEQVGRKFEAFLGFGGRRVGVHSTLKAAANAIEAAHARACEVRR